MFKRLIISEQDRNHILTMYGIINEQEESKTKLYTLSGFYLSVNNNNLFAGRYNNNVFTPTSNLNGRLQEFVVEVDRKNNTLNLLNDNFKENVRWTTDNWSELTTNQDNKPSQYSNVQFKFIAITPENQRQGAGTPRLYTGNVLFKSINDADTSVMMESRKQDFGVDGIKLNPYNYVRVNKRGKPKRNGNYVYWIKLYPGMVGQPFEGKKEDNSETITLSLDLSDVFVFDKIEFKNETQVYEQMDRLVEEINNLLPTLSDFNKERLSIAINRTPIYGYASIDSDPNSSEIGYYEGCQGKKTNGEYNQCLSEARAKVVADYLNEKFKDNSSINFKYKGMGGTKMFNNVGWPDSKGPDETAENRRVVFNIKDLQFKQ